MTGPASASTLTTMLRTAQPRMPMAQTPRGAQRSALLNAFGTHLTRTADGPGLLITVPRLESRHTMGSVVHPLEMTTGALAANDRFKLAFTVDRLLTDAKDLQRELRGLPMDWSPYAGDLGYRTAMRTQDDYWVMTTAEAGEALYLGMDEDYHTGTVDVATYDDLRGTFVEAAAFRQAADQRFQIGLGRYASAIGARLYLMRDREPTRDLLHVRYRWHVDLNNTLMRQYLARHLPVEYLTPSQLTLALERDITDLTGEFSHIDNVAAVGSREPRIHVRSLVDFEVAGRRLPRFEISTDDDGVVHLDIAGILFSSGEHLYYEQSNEDPLVVPVSPLVGTLHLMTENLFLTGTVGV
jgi:hypothetical protein